VVVREDHSVFEPVGLDPLACGFDEIELGARCRRSRNAGFFEREAGACEDAQNGASKVKHTPGGICAVRETAPTSRVIVQVGSSSCAGYASRLPLRHPKRRRRVLLAFFFAFLAIDFALYRS
jgi:hypothetical protein